MGKLFCRRLSSIGIPLSWKTEYLKSSETYCKKDGYYRRLTFIRINYKILLVIVRECGQTLD